jgi:hypothetical protein
MPAYYDLKRRFVERPKYDPDELISSEISGRRLDWAKVLTSRFAVIVAPANYGKTTEMCQRAVHMRTSGEAAFFVALRKVSERHSVEKALDLDELNAFRAWSASPTTALTVFVDSLDEASAGKQDDIDYLVRNVTEAVQWPNVQVRWVISTRPAVLTADVIGKLSAVLVSPFLAASVSVSTSSTMISAGVTTTEPITSGAATEPEKLLLYSMAPLESKQGELYLQSKYPAANPTELLRIARERGLAGLVSSPGGLDVLANIDLVARPPESLTDVFQRVVAAVQQLQSQDPRIEDAGSPAPMAVTEAVHKLASASQVCQLPNIEIPEEKLGVTQGVLSARLIASSLLSERALRQLLNSQLFIDVGHHQVKLYPDELLPFLGAQRLSGLVQSAEHAHKLVETFSWRSPTGEQGVYRKFLPLMGWLATLNQHCREEILERDPQAVAFFGDLRNSNMPLTVAKAALRDSIRRLAEQGDRLGRGYFNLTSENFWQAGADILKPLLQELFKEYGDKYRARDALLDIATSCRSDALRQFVLDKHGGDYRPLLLQSIDVRYLLELGLDADLAALAQAVKVEHTAGESLVSVLMTRLGWTYLSYAELAELVHRQFQLGRGGFYMSSALGAGLLDSANDLQLYAFARSLVVKVARLRDREGRDRTTCGRTDDRFVELVTEVLASLSSRTSFTKHRRVALLCLVLQRVICDANFGSADISELRSSLQENAPVRRCLLRLIVRHAGQDSGRLWRGVYGYGSMCPVSVTDVQALGLESLTSIFDEREAIQAAHRAKPEPAPQTREKRFKLGLKVKKELLDMLEQLRDGSATNGLAWTAGWLLQTNPNSRYGEVNIDVLECEGGKKIAQAVREGFSKVWRMRQPTCKEDEPRTTYQVTVAGLQGLHLELQEGKDLPALSDDEVRNALSYGVFEINGYPKWFWPLVQAHEAVAGQELRKMVQRACTGAVSLEHAEALLTSLEDAPQAVQAQLAPLAWTFLQEQPNLRDYVVEKLLRVATEVSSVTTKADFEGIAWRKMEAAFSGPLPKEEEKARTARDARKQAVAWASSWLMGYPSTFRKTLDKWLRKSPANARALIFELAAHLGRDRGSQLVRLAQMSDEGVDVLGALYQWTLETVRPEEDNDHTDGEVYTSGPRDSAEELRDALIPAIAAARSQRAYEVLERLRLAASGPRAMYLRSVQVEMREAQAARPPIAQQRYNDFERDFTADVTDTTSFSMAVHADLLAVKYDIEQGEFSLRRFFSDLSFKRTTSEDEGLALEVDFQKLLASELNHLARGRYSVTVEPHTAEAKRRDVLCSKGDMYASIELKMSRRWTLEKYVEALEKQLVGQYMRHRKANTGFLVIVLQEVGKRWTDTATGKKVDFEGLLTILRDKALELEAKNRARYLRVIGIDATPPANFRDEKMVPARKGARGSAPVKQKLTTIKKPAAKATKAQEAAKPAGKVAPAKKNPSARLKQTGPQQASSRNRLAPAKTTAVEPKVRRSKPAEGRTLAKVPAVEKKRARSAQMASARPGSAAKSEFTKATTKKRLGR